MGGLPIGMLHAGARGSGGHPEADVLDDLAGIVDSGMTRPDIMDVWLLRTNVARLSLGRRAFRVEPAVIQPDVQ